MPGINREGAVLSELPAEGNEEATNQDGSEDEQPSVTAESESADVGSAALSATRSYTSYDMSDMAKIAPRDEVDTFTGLETFEQEPAYTLQMKERITDEREHVQNATSGMSMQMSTLKSRFDDDQTSLIENLMQDRSSIQTYQFPSSVCSLPQRVSEHSIHKVPTYIEPKIDRNLYYGLHQMYSSQLQEAKRKNNSLQTKMANHYLKRKLFHLLHEGKYTSDEQKRYDRILDELDGKHEVCTREQASLEDEILLLKRKNQIRKEEVGTLFEKLLTMEHEFTKVIGGAADEKAKVAAEKFVERYIKRQKHSITLLQSLRLAHIKIKNRFNEAQERVEQINKVGSHLHLRDYIQLKNDNRNLCDKLEEKELNLTTIRKQCQNGMQILAHSREKLCAMNTDIESYNETLDSVTDECADIREQVGYLKLERDGTRREIRKIKDNIGLLGKPKLLRDMENTIKEMQDGKMVLEQYKQECKVAGEQIRRLRGKSVDDIMVYIEKYKHTRKQSMPKKYKKSKASIGHLFFS